ncbi:MAG TPA: hypothetical protein VHH36_03910 [Candidatus Thermoplasmatota archaeon]|nr:hypothetical protein [Candidatus Thermoplasmatota archaeon]
MPSASSMTPMAVTRRPEKRDWVAWYEELQPGERRELRNRLVEAAYDDVKADAELRQFFFFHSEDLAHEQPPGADRLAQLHAILQAMRAEDGPEVAEQRRKAVAFLLAEYQRFLRDNPWCC